MGPRLPRQLGSTGEIHYYGLKVDKRLTDVDARSDQIWVRFSVDTDTDSADVEACMYFTLYNDGWLLDDIKILSTKLSPLVGPSREMVSSYLSEQYDYFQYQREEIDLENGFAKFYYKAMNEYTYADYGYELCLNYYYSGSYWGYGGVELIEETQDWRRVYGTWEGTDRRGGVGGSVTYSLEVSSITYNFLPGELLIDGGLNFNDSSTYWNTPEIHESFRFSVFPSYIHNDFFSIELSLNSSSYSPRFWIDREDGVSFQPGDGLSCYAEKIKNYTNVIENTFFIEFFDGDAEVETGYSN